MLWDAESAYLDPKSEKNIVNHGAVCAPMTYRLAFGPNAGKKALMLQAVPVSEKGEKGSNLVSKQSGFSTHAGVACESNQRKTPERLCR